jgi:hypothetical protein
VLSPHQSAQETKYEARSHADPVWMTITEPITAGVGTVHA